MRQKAERFDHYLEARLKSPAFRKHFQRARLATELAHRIVELRRRQGLTQTELARRMGTKQQTICRLERGDYQGFTLKTLLKIAEATKTHLVVDFRRTGS
jgi:DNA-binding XRE family transcriptional regulator